MAKIYCIANQKGGVGKTTTAVNLAAALSQLSFNVLLVDLDPQGNATTGSGLEKNNLVQSVYEVLLDRADIKKVITHSTSGYDILGSNRKLAAAEEELLSAARKELRLKTKLDEVSGQYDVIIIDCPPTLSILTINAFCAADGLIIPMTCEYYSLEGVSDLLLSIRAVREQVNSGLVITGLLRVKFASSSPDISGHRFSLPLFRQMFASQKPLATDFQGFSTTPHQEAPYLIKRLQKNL